MQIRVYGLVVSIVSSARRCTPLPHKAACHAVHGVARHTLTTGGMHGGGADRRGRSAKPYDKPRTPPAISPRQHAVDAWHWNRQPGSCCLAPLLLLDACRRLLQCAPRQRRGQGKHRGLESADKNIQVDSSALQRCNGSSWSQLAPEMSSHAHGTKLPAQPSPQSSPHKATPSC